MVLLNIFLRLEFHENILGAEKKHFNIRAYKLLVILWIDKNDLRIPRYLLQKSNKMSLNTMRWWFSIPTKKGLDILRTLPCDSFSISLIEFLHCFILRPTSSSNSPKLCHVGHKFNIRYYQFIEPLSDLLLRLSRDFTFP